MAWRWHAASFGPSTARATATYVDGRLITVSGDRRHVVALDPATGELLWSFTEPNTHRFEYSCGRATARALRTPRSMDGVSCSSPHPAFFLHALDVETGEPLENWGRPVPVDGFRPTGTVDLLRT